MLRFSNFILKASQSDNPHISMCANLAYFSDTPVAGNMRVLSQILNTDSVINIKIKHVKKIIMFYQKMLNIRQVILKNYVIYEMVHIRVIYYLTQTLSQSLIFYVVHEVYICFLC